MSRTLFHVIVFALILAGVATACMRHIHTNLPFLPGEEKDVWLVEARIDYSALGPSKVSFALPTENRNFRLYSEQSASQGYGYSTVMRDTQRRAEWTKRETRGLQTLYYKAQFVAENTDLDPSTASPQEAKAVFLDEPIATAAKQSLDLAYAKSSDSISLARELIKLINATSLEQNIALLLEHQPQKAYLLDTLLNLANIPSNVVLGLHLEDARRRQSLTPMLEIFNNGRWHIFNPVTGQHGTPEDFLIWHRSKDGLLEVTGGHNSNVGFSMIKQTIPALQLAQTQHSDSLFDLISIHRLPIEQQSMFKLLFLLPLGALVVVFMRIIVGIKTAGTFMPILLALAFLYTKLIPGLLSFTLIVVFGLLLRGYLSKLNLLMVARIAALIVLVVFIISIMSYVSFKLGLENTITATFFPMVIIAWTIERMSILWEEEGGAEVLTQGLGSMVVAVLAYFLMTNSLLSHLSFNFPELNLVILALVLLIGQYTGYRLSELRRFRDLVKVIDHAN